MDPIIYYSLLGALIGFAIFFAMDVAIFRKNRTGGSDDSLRGQLSNAHTEIKRLKQQAQESENLSKQIRDRDSEIETLKQKVIQFGSNSEEVQNLRNLSDNHQAELDRMAAENAELLKAKDSLTRQIQEAGVFDQYEILGKLDVAEEEIQKLHEVLSHHESENNDLSKRVAELADQNEQAHSLLSSKESEIEFHAQKIRDLEAIRATDQNKQSEIESLQSTLVQKEDEISALDWQIQELASKVQHLEGIASAHDDLKQEMDSKGVEIAKYRAEMQTKDSHIGVIEGRLSEANDRLHDTIQKLQEHADAQQQMLDLEQVMAAKDDHIQRLENNLRELEDEITSHRTAMKELQDAKSKIEAEANSQGSLRSEIEDQEREIATLRQSLMHAKSEVNTDWEERLNKAHFEADTLRKDVQSLREVSSSKDQAIADALAKVSHLESQLAFRPSSEELVSLKKTIGEKDSQIQDLMSKILELEKAEAQAPVVSRPVIPTSQRDPLIKINGIGHLYERKLWEAGILRFGDLSRLNADQIFEIIQPAEWQRIEPEKWIAEASQMSQEAVS